MKSSLRRELTSEKCFSDHRLIELLVPTTYQSTSKQPRLQPAMDEVCYLRTRHLTREEKVARVRAEADRWMADQQGVWRSPPLPTLATFRALSTGFQDHPDYDLFYGRTVASMRLLHEQAKTTPEAEACCDRTMKKTSRAFPTPPASPPTDSSTKTKHSSEQEMSDGKVCEPSRRCPPYSGLQYPWTRYYISKTTSLRHLALNPNGKLMKNGVSRRRTDSGVLR